MTDVPLSEDQRALSREVQRRIRLEQELDQARDTIVRSRDAAKEAEVSLAKHQAAVDELRKKLQCANKSFFETLRVVESQRDALNRMELELSSIHGTVATTHVQLETSRSLSRRVETLRRQCVDRARALTAWLSAHTSSAPRKK